MDDLLPHFLVEGRELVEQAHADLARLEAAPAKGEGVDRPALDSLFRAVHTLKGSVALFAMAPAEALLHAAETRLDRARRDGSTPDGAALLAVVDQVDRWIDAMEADGALPAAAGEDAQRLIARLAGEAAPAAPAPDAIPEWATVLRDRSERAAEVRTAFRYTPDAECFFRGEDPLAVVGTVPGLLHLDMVTEQPWPELSAMEPFRCYVRFEGASAASAEEVRAAFRLMPDQIEVAALPGPADGTRAPDTPQTSAPGTLRVDAVRLDGLVERSADLSVASRALDPLVARAAALDPALADALKVAQAGIERAAADLQQAIASVRLVSLEPVLRRLPRLARDAATGLGKAVRFELSGERAEVDKQVADGLFEPLLHLVRNAIDHGIEPPQARRAAGKAEAGLLRLAIATEGDRLRITLTDDGAGMDAAAIRRAAVARELIGEAEAAALDDEAAIGLVFLPGFSTAAAVTDLSGRGVGMDAVRTAIERLRGTIAIDSRTGQGTRVSVLLPVNAIATRLLVVTAGEQRLGVRLDQVSEIVRLHSAAIQPIGRGQACVLRDRTVPVLDLGQRLGLAPATGDHARLLVTDGGAGGRVALRVDGFGERIDGFVREKSGILSRLPAVSGTTTLGDGEVLLVLDLPELLA